MSYYEDFIALRTYSRFRDELGRRETWPESVQRLIDWWCEKYPEHEKWFRETAQPAIEAKEVMPSMRSLQTAGKALDRDHVAGYNPVSGDTRVVTREYGNIPIRDLDGMGATVLNKNGEWADATFCGYGNQRLYKVTVRLNSNTIKEVYSTNSHRWVLQDGTVKPTIDLKPHDRIDFASAPKPKTDDDYILGIRHGLIYGDGVATKTCSRVRGYHIRLCGENDELLWAFSGYPVTYPKSCGGDPVVMLYDGFAATHDLKELPSQNETEPYLLGFIRGWIAADGHVTKRGSQVSLCVGGNNDLPWLQDVSEKIGFVIQSKYKQKAETNYGKRKSDSYVVRFSRSSFTVEDLICSWKRDAFRPLNSRWVVSSIEETESVSDVYCAQVPDTNTFTLEGGLVTGNCSYTPIDDPRCFDEIMYILLCGTGVGFSVERQYVSKLPEIPEEFHEVDTEIVVPDSKVGWASSFRQLVSLLYSGQVPRWNMKKIRPAGARLKTFGGRASGPQPLRDLFQFTVEMFRHAAGRQLSSLECHDLVCKIGDVVVVGGVRRSALISLSNLSDDRMRMAKSGQWWVDNPQRALANNSACYTEKPEFLVFLDEWRSLYESRSGERGIFNRKAARNQAKRNGRRDSTFQFGTNPCSEILLRARGFCNLTECVIRPDDSYNSIRRKVQIATILGTFQSSLTDFRYLRKEWRKNAEEERLLGVSLTGIMDHPRLSSYTQNEGDKNLSEVLDALREHSIKVNKEWAEKIGINQSAAITCVKPSGTVSQLCNTASGIHPRFSDYYLRAVRTDKKDPLAHFMIDKGFIWEEDVYNNDNYVFFFPIKSPEDSLTADNVGAMDQLALWEVYQDHWCEHKPSMTCYYNDDEFLGIGNWVWNRFDKISGISFLPRAEHIYQQAPYRALTREEYEEYLSQMPVDIDWTELVEYEGDDFTEGGQILACHGGSCEL